MKKIKKLIKKLNNRGSSIIMVIVSIAFVAVIVGALLTAAGYAYRLKLINKNAKDNFYYVEQAMQEIYAGVGAKTVDQMYDAYTSTIENMVYYDLSNNAYTTLSNDAANKMFKERFMVNILNEDYFKQSDTDLAASLENFISNKTVHIDKTALHLKKVTGDDNTLEKIVLQNVTLTREIEYSNNSGAGTYTQTVSADIVISQPDFEVNFNTTTTDYSTLFDYAMIGDMGIEVDDSAATVLKITGNIYAAADYYNKSYNAEVTASSDSDSDSDDSSDAKKNPREYSYKAADNTTISYTHSAVSSKKYTGDSDTGLKSKTAKDTISGKYLTFDGENSNSVYSGLYISNSNVSILADTIIVPGTIAVMNNSDLSVYNNESGNITQSEVWADNIVLGGYGEKQSSVQITQTTEENQTSYKAPSAYFYANLFVRDDTELNAESGSFELNGSYYGYGNSTEKDTRVFVPTVNEENFKVPVTVEDEAGNKTTTTQNRDHYNSSAIIINGENTTLNLKNADVLYLAGRAYIELSKDAKTNVEDGTDAENNVKDGKVYLTSDGKLTDTATDNTEVVTETFSYNPGTKDSTTNKVTTYLSDYKTGESLAVKSTQLAYIPIILNGVPADHKIADTTYTCVKLHPSVAGVAFFGVFFPESVFADGYVPVISQQIGNKTYYYYDLETAYEILKKQNANVTNTYKSSEEYSAAFIKAYTDEAKNPTDPDNPLPLNDILTNSDFSIGNITLSGSTGDGSNTTIYSSGAITTMKNKTFNMIVKNSSDFFNASSFYDANGNFTSVWDALLTSNGVSEAANAAADVNATKALAFSKSISTEYLYMKWNLGHFDANEQNEQDYVDEFISAGWTEDMLTPINRYMVFSNIDKTITPMNLTLSSGYKVWISKDDVVIGENTWESRSTDSGEKSDFNSQGVVKGIVITEGDVTFTDDVKKFEGLIISGGKIYVGKNVESITASSEICRSIIKECIVVNDDDSKYIRSLFTQYKISDDGKCPTHKVLLVDKTDSEGNVVTDSENNAVQVCPIEGCSYNGGSDDTLLVEVENIDYTDVCSMDNWTKKVE